jgi:uncharacterized protein YbbC (DUF1343 family)
MPQPAGQVRGMKLGMILSLCFALFACSAPESTTQTFTLTKHATVHSEFAANPVRLGDDRIFDDYAAEFQGKRIGILAHFASRLSNGTHVVDALKANPNFKLSMIFSPEHGFRSVDDTTVTDSIDPATGVQIYSLYGPRKAPTPEMLAQLDVVLVDLQDVGLRYYTYPATVTYLLRAAKTAGKPVYILDRPNPLSGAIVEGAVLDQNLANGDLTTIAQIPTRTGMTLGETALYLNQELAVGADLHVIPMSGWERSMHWKDTGLTWTPSSPALADPDQVELYAMFGTLEAAALAVGRGQLNNQAFRRYGAPYITQAQAQAIVAALQIPGLKFSYLEWTPDRSNYVNQLCRGFQIEITDLTEVDAFQALVNVSKVMQATLGTELKFSDSLDMLGGKWLLNGILNQNATLDLVAHEATALQTYLAKRAAVLQYP